MMIGIGTPISQRRIERPMSLISFVEANRNGHLAFEVAPPRATCAKAVR